MPSSERSGPLRAAASRARRLSWPTLGFLWVGGLLALLLLDQLVLEVPPSPAAAAVVDILHPVLRVLVVGGLAGVTFLRIRDRRKHG